MLGFAPLAATALGAPSASEAYALNATSGTFTLSMQGAGKLITDIYPSGVFATNGRAVTFRVNRPATFGTGIFTLTGQDITLDQNFGLIIDSVYNNATFAYSGQNVVLDVGFGMVINSQAFTYSGQNVDFKKDMNIAAERGSFILTGQNAAQKITDIVDTGTFTYSGQTVEMTAQRHFDANTGEFAYTFQEFKIKGWLTPVIPAETWSDVTPVPPPIWTEVA